MQKIYPSPNQNEKGPVKLECLVGTWINDAIKEALEYRDSIQKPVSFEFNGIELICYIGDTLEQILNHYNVSREKRSKEYWNPEKLKAEKESKQKDREELERFFKNLSEVSSLEDMIKFMCGLEKRVWIHAPLSSFQHDEIESVMSKLGVIEDMNCRKDGESEAEWEKRIGGREGKLKWLLGQCFGTPHQLVHSFAKSFGVK